MLMVRGTAPRKGSCWMDVSDLALFSPEARGGGGVGERSVWGSSMASLAYCSSTPKGHKVKEHGTQLGRYFKGFKWWAGSENVWISMSRASKSVPGSSWSPKARPLRAPNLHKL